MSWIVRETFALERPGHTPVEIVVAVGAPKLADAADWACEVEVGPEGPRSSTIHGISARQALALSLRFVADTLSHLQSQGSLRFPGGVDEVELEPLFGFRSRFGRSVDP